MGKKFEEYIESIDKAIKYIEEKNNRLKEVGANFLYLDYKDEIFDKYHQVRKQFEEMGIDFSNAARAEKNYYIPTERDPMMLGTTIRVLPQNEQGDHAYTVDHLICVIKASKNFLVKDKYRRDNQRKLYENLHSILQKKGYPEETLRCFKWQYVGDSTVIRGPQLRFEVTDDFKKNLMLFYSIFACPLFFQMLPRPIMNENISYQVVKMMSSLEAPNFVERMSDWWNEKFFSGLEKIYGEQWKQRMLDWSFFDNQETSFRFYSPAISRHGVSYVLGYQETDLFISIIFESDLLGCGGNFDKICEILKKQMNRDHVRLLNTSACRIRGANTKCDNMEDNEPFGSRIIAFTKLPSGKDIRMVPGSADLNKENMEHDTLYLFAGNDDMTYYSCISPSEERIWHHPLLIGDKQNQPVLTPLKQEYIDRLDKESMLVPISKRGHIYPYKTRLKTLNHVSESIDENTVRNCMQQIVEGLYYLKVKEKRAHGSLRLDTVLYFSDSLIDTTHFKLFYESLKDINDDWCSSFALDGNRWETQRPYLPPDLKKAKNSGSEDAFTREIWALGQILHKLKTGEFLEFTKEMENSTRNEQIEQINKKLDTNLKSAKNINNDEIEFIKMLLNPDPVKRISLEGIMKHKWFKKNWGQSKSHRDLISEARMPIYLIKEKAAAKTKMKKALDEWVTSKMVGLFINPALQHTHEPKTTKPQHEEESETTTPAVDHLRKKPKD